MITLKDIPTTYYGGFDVKLPNGWTAKVRVEDNEDSGRGMPWQEEDGHGKVRTVRTLRDTLRGKRAGERIMHQDGGTAWLYDFAGAMEIAKRDGWGCGHAHLTKRQVA